jgi:hypothetical protein
MKDEMRDPKVERSKRAREGSQDHRNALELLRQSRETADQDYVMDAAGFWLERIWAYDEQRVTA